eukprot:TRINITY_DN2672_c0_g1_i17.p1 TRINITY_DN2672_c0_g1~~TRINITY_DN2672_c0_g1_i17.p1  ORF type:complete len:948 (+),score=178.50 TRINITY_DN2672_c0_g1_i17:60-2903(+)
MSKRTTPVTLPPLVLPPTSANHEIQRQQIEIQHQQIEIQHQQIEIQHQQIEIQHQQIERINGTDPEQKQIDSFEGKDLSNHTDENDEESEEDVDNEDLIAAEIREEENPELTDTALSSDLYVSQDESGDLNISSIGSSGSSGLTGSIGSIGSIGSNGTNGSNPIQGRRMSSPIIKSPRGTRQRENVLHISSEWDAFWKAFLSHFEHLHTLSSSHFSVVSSLTAISSASSHTNLLQQMQSDAEFFRSAARWEPPIIPATRVNQIPGKHAHSRNQNTHLHGNDHTHFTPTHGSGSAQVSGSTHGSASASTSALSESPTNAHHIQSSETSPHRKSQSLPPQARLTDSFYFPIRYRVSDYVELLARIYPAYWSFFTQRKEFYGKHVLFYAHLRSLVNTPARLPTDDPLHKSDEWSVDAIEFARAALHYMRIRHLILRQKVFWWKGKVPKILPRAFAEKVHLDIFDGKQVEVLNIGDLHGSAGVVLNFVCRLKEKNIISDDWKLLNDHTRIIFTGDFADRGYFGMEIWLVVLYLLIRNPSQVHVVKANHEYGAESDFRKFETPAKLHLSVNDYPKLFYRLAETFPDFLFLTCEDNGVTKCYNYTHGAVDYGYNPKGFLSSPDAKFHQIVLYDRTWFYDHLRTSDPDLFERVEACRDYEAIPATVPPFMDGIATGCGPTWNYHHNGELVSIGTYGHGLHINREMLRTIYAAWDASEEHHGHRRRRGSRSSAAPHTAQSPHNSNHGEDVAGWIVRRLKGALRAAGVGSSNQTSTRPPRVIFRVCIGGHEHTNIRDVHFLSQAQRQHGVGYLWDLHKPDASSPYAAPAALAHHGRITQIRVDPTAMAAPPIAPPIAPAASANDSKSHERTVQALQDSEPHEIRFMIYKFFNMLDLVYYRLSSVSSGCLTVSRHNGVVSDSIKTTVIADINNLYAMRTEFQRLYDANLTRQDPNLH